MKKIDKILTHFGDALCKKFFLKIKIKQNKSHMVFNLTIEWTPHVFSVFSLWT